MRKRKTTGLIYSNNRVGMLYALSCLAAGISLFTCLKVWKDSALIFSSLNLSFPSSLLGLFVLLMVGNIFLLCLFWLDSRYVLKIERVNQNYVLITTWRLLRKSKKTRYYDGILRDVKPIEHPHNLYWTPMVQSPWTLLKTPQGRKLVIDHSGDFLEGHWQV